MEGHNGSKLICQVCKKTYSAAREKNRHMRKFHPELATQPKPMKKRIICPLCPQRNDFGTHSELRRHLCHTHNIDIKQSSLYFKNLEEFESWKSQDNKEKSYFCLKNSSEKNGRSLVYSCIRSNCQGRVSKSKIRHRRVVDNKLIDGVCPSRIEVKVKNTGEVSVQFIETHVGHDDQLSFKRLTKAEENKVREQLVAGVSIDGILANARRIENGQLQRINLLKRQDVRNIINKYNIEAQQCSNDLDSAALKANEWNMERRNYAFLYKNIGQKYDGLEDEDFAVGYMNDMMWSRIKEHNSVICIDATHGTDKRNYELTTILIKDEHNIGFPIAFLLSNRLEQVVLEIFFRALRLKLGNSIKTDFLMSEDDPKYFNAWSKIMTHNPRRLLSPWHVIKCWNIHGRSKLKNAENRRHMEIEMRKILQETNITKFHFYKDMYLQYLEDAGEHEFLNYLKTYYFQSEERIRMWAHCHRVGASISTNLAIESFNKLLNYNKLQRQCNIGVERLLDLLEEIVNERMWQAIINVERPDANNYQYRATMQSHKKAIDLEGKVEAQGSGMFKVPSSTDNNEYYIVSTIEKCSKGCTFGYCSQCEVCLHVYKCDCPENSIKYVLCIHIHAVALFKKKAENVVDAIIENDGDDTLCFSEDEHDSIHIKMENEDDTRLSVEASTSSQNESKNNILQMNFDKTLQECRKRLHAVNPEKVAIWESIVLATAVRFVDKEERSANRTNK
ncbi:uncharacterized protein LOC143199837 [Rhynchophorus ferrugineus]|uniref:uncharacterized protein LOC143199837 n=1 Tax=Rhynchophorus ferrugineus TaxID=354439 RepID=UPI003FCC3536